jgi:hypothetical protein
MHPVFLKQAGMFERTTGRAMKDRNTCFKVACRIERSNN